jgi:hypothetical protein
MVDLRKRNSSVLLRGQSAKTRVRQMPESQKGRATMDVTLEMEESKHLLVSHVVESQFIVSKANLNIFS